MNNWLLREIERDREELRRKYSTSPKPVLHYDKLQQRNDDLMGESNKSKETSWADVISKIGKSEREKSNILSPNRMRIRYLSDYATEIGRCVGMINSISKLAYEDIVPFDQAQKILEYQKELLYTDLLRMATYIDISEEAKNIIETGEIN